MLYLTKRLEMVAILDSCQANGIRALTMNGDWILGKIRVAMIAVVTVNIENNIV